MPEQLSDPELIGEVTRLAALECSATASLVAALGEMDARRLYLGQGCSSMFTYCTQVLHLAEHAAFNRIEAARAARRFPIILALLEDGRLHLSAVRLLAPHLTDSNHEAVLKEASHKSKREVEEIVARLQPQPDVPSSIRKLPSANAAPHPGQSLTLKSDRPKDASARMEVVPLSDALSMSPQQPAAKPLARGDTRCSSPSPKRRIRSSVRCRISFAIDCRTAILRRSSIAH
jgi:hypothetical protein